MIPPHTANKICYVTRPGCPRSAAATPSDGNQQLLPDQEGGCLGPVRSTPHGNRCSSPLAVCKRGFSIDLQAVLSDCRSRLIAPNLSRQVTSPASGARNTWAVMAFALVIAVLLVLQGCAGPSSRPADDSATPSATGAPDTGVSKDAASLDPDYRIGSDDLLEIGVLGVADLSRTVRVNSSGGISMPLIGMIHVAGLTSSEAEALLEKEYEKDYLQNPQISVFIKEFTTQRFTVDGAVSKPGVYPLVGNMTLLRALATAGGKGELADLENVMLFRVASDGQIEKKHYDVLKIRTGEEPDPLLRRDDMVVVNRNASRVGLRDSLFGDILSTLNPFSLR